MKKDYGLIFQSSDKSYRSNNYYSVKLTCHLSIRENRLTTSIYIDRVITYQANKRYLGIEESALRHVIFK